MLDSRTTTLLALSTALLCFAACKAADSDEVAESAQDNAGVAEVEMEPISQSIPPEFQMLFDGESLKGWTPKFAGHPLGDNVRNTFRVEDGLLKVSYDEYEAFDGLFGHLFADGEFENYEVRAEYRFVGDQCPGAPGWAFRNNGIMFHGQTPASMSLDQKFPVSIEAQMLGHTDPNAVRANGGVCTPGTHIEIGGELVTDHCVPSDGPTNAGDDWVSMSVFAYGDGRVLHFIDEILVHEYAGTQLDPNDSDAKALIAGGAGITLRSGTISIQAESHPIEFRRIEIRSLDE